MSAANYITVPEQRELGKLQCRMVRAAREFTKARDERIAKWRLRDATRRSLHRS